jgi:hypothetical protein
VSTTDHDAGTGEWARIPLRAWLVEDLRHTLRAAERHLHEHTDTDTDGAREILRDLGYHAGLLGWYLHKYRTGPTGSTTPTTTPTTCQESSR